ncbi:sigma-70 family RNA polymerase sigma factor [Sandarakinorhabdus sp.]|uniref:sigma-70 family RNA polymerase sigma factor n=1 Tax=Sandarakinorhabdus sp. TaxID=1916663 RepID=UPI00286E148E|nr:sigma-70 family RNA polymerase sigma factor [Sandarakinorhabdus sp.]
MTVPDHRPLPASETPALRDLGAALRLAFAEVAAAPLPPRLQALLDQLGDGAAPPAADRFKADLAAAIPHLRAYGRSLSGNADLADDLVQETMLKAWMARDRFVAGSSMRAWTHVILRNAYFSIARRARFKGEWDEFAADLLLAVPPAQEGHVALADMQRALMQLPATQREALILMGASGMSCEEVAAISNCAVGTVKSRVARARAALRDLLDGGQLAQSRADGPVSALGPLDQIMRQAQQLTAAR